MKRKISFIVAVFLTVFVPTIKAQQAIPFSEKNNLKLELKAKLGLQKPSFSLHTTHPVFSDNTFINQRISFVEMAQSAKLNGDYYVNHLGFFCTKEYKFEKTTRIPLKFRLGSLEYCNYLEGKR